MTFVIAGVSGNTGSVVAATLLAHRERVRVLVRNASEVAPWTTKGADAFEGGHRRVAPSTSLDAVFRPLINQ